jgi:hypothetical protein
VSMHGGGTIDKPLQEFVQESSSIFFGFPGGPGPPRPTSPIFFKPNIRIFSAKDGSRMLIDSNR